MIHTPTPNCLRHVLLAILPVTVTSGESIAETFVVWDPGSGATLFYRQSHSEVKFIRAIFSCSLQQFQ